MKRVNLNASLRFLCFLLLSILSTKLYAQGVQTMRPNVPINPNCNGYIEYLPEGYSSGTQRYPLLLFIGGMGTTGDGSLAALENHFTNGGFPHEQIRNGTWVDAYTVNGQTFRFVIITPQFIEPYWKRAPTPEEINSVLNFAIANYRIDTSRIYMTGNSSGGGPVWDYPGASSAYADRLAAIIPFCGAAFPAQEKANNIKYSNLPVWTFHNEFDSGVPVSFTRDFVRMINNPTPPDPPAKMTIFPQGGHDAWFHPYTRVYTEDNKNIYEWMLQYKRTVSKAKAGVDKEIAHPVNSVQLNGSGTGPNGTTGSVSWSRISGPAASFSNTSVLNPVVSGLAVGSYIFRLTISDNTGATATDDVAITVHPSSTRIEAENFIAMSGVQTESTGDVGGGLNVGYINNGDWMDYSINAPSAGTYTVRYRVSSFDPEGQFLVKNAAGTVLDTVKVYNTGSWQTYMTLTRSITIPAGQQTIRIQSSSPYSFNFNWWEIVDGAGGSTPGNLPPTANAGADQTITLPVNSVQLNGSGTDPEGTALTFNWTKVSGPAGESISSAGSASTAVNGLSAGTYTFRLRVTDNAGSSTTDDVIITVNGAGSSSARIEAENWTAMQGVQTENVSDIGGGQNVGYIDNGDWMEYSINPSATGSYLLNFRIATAMSGGQFQLRKADGTVLATLTVPNTGGWQTWQTISANANLSSGQQTVRIISVASGNWNINWFEFSPGSTPGNQAPTANAGTDQTITLPVNSVTLNGSGNDPEGTSLTYSWTKVSGPAGENISSATSASTSVSGLTAGTYVFRLTVTDAGGSTGTDDVSIVVNSSSSTTTLRIQAESFTAMSGVQTEGTGDAGGGQNVGWIDNGDWMEYSINVPSAGTYTFSARVATQQSGGQLQVKKDNVVLTTLNIPNTGGWQAWQTSTASTTLNLGQGQQTIRIQSSAGANWNINWFELTGGSSTPGNLLPTANAGADVTITLPANSVSLSGSGTDNDGTIASYIWSQISGPSSATIQSPSSAQTTVSNLAQGSYIFRLTVTDNAGGTGTDEVTVTVNGSTTPPGGTIRIEAENWSAMSGVQTESTGDVGGGQNVGWIDNGDWMEYSINPASSGTYTANFRISTAMSGAQIQVRKADGSILATVNVPNTGGWQNWQTTSVPITLASGQQTIRLVSMNGSSWNINWFELVSGGTPPPPPPVTTRVEAESFSAMSGVQIEGTGDVGGGQNVGWIENGDWMEYSITTSSASTFTMNFRISTPNNTAQFQVRKTDGTVLATVNLPNTGGWQSWQTVSASVPLVSGTQTIRIISTNAAGFNINWLEVVTPSSPSADVVSGRIEPTAAMHENRSLEVYPNPVHDLLTIRLDNQYEGSIRIQVTDMNGAVLKELIWNKTRGTSQLPVNLGRLKSGSYILSIRTPEGKQTTRLIKF